MKYKKPPLTFPQQAKQLIERGLEANEAQLIKILSDVSYYRLSGYWYPFKNNDDTFKSNTTIEKIWQRYVFDRELRLLLMKAIEIIEVSIKTKMTENFSLQYGPFGHLYSEGFSNSFDVVQHGKFIKQIRNNSRNSREIFVSHFLKKYGDSHKDLPLWMAIEVMTFGNMLTMFRNLQSHMQRETANKFNVAGKVLESWLVTLNYIRNSCAHHARIWNRVLSIRPVIPAFKNNPEFHSPIDVKMSQKRIFSVLIIMKYLLNQIGESVKWATKIRVLLDENPEIPIKSMGFPENWKECPIWKRE